MAAEKVSNSVPLDTTIVMDTGIMGKKIMDTGNTGHEILAWQLPGEKKFVEFICGICLKICLDPTILKNQVDEKDEPCDHSFCSKSLAVKKQCPICRKQTMLRHRSKDTRLKRSIGELQVSCVFKQHGCSWYRSMGPSARDYLEHQIVCSFRGAPCSDCKEVVPWGTELIHAEICLERMVVCKPVSSVTKGCGDKRKRNEMKTHYQWCPQHFVECEYVKYEHKSCRYGLDHFTYLELEAHKVDAVLLHTQLELGAKIEEREKEIKKLSVSLAKMEFELEKIKQEKRNPCNYVTYALANGKKIKVTFQIL